MAGKLDKIIAQLRKLDSIETTLKGMCDNGAKIEEEECNGRKIQRSGHQSRRNGHSFNWVERTD